MSASEGNAVIARSSSVPNGARFNGTKLMPVLDELHERLTGVVIECLPWADFVARYDRPTMPFCLDPPYWGGETDYGVRLFERAEYERLAGTRAPARRLQVPLQAAQPVHLKVGRGMCDLRQRAC
jgi:hypothetical protein